MFKSAIIRAYLALFAINSWRQAIWKLPLIFGAIGGLSLLMEVFVGGDTWGGAVQSLRTDMMIAFPFVLGGVIVMNHLVELQNKLSAMALTDQLTGLPNRHAFFKRARPLIEAGQKGVLVLADADQFKRINDTYGHAAGDVCLCAIATFLRQMAPPDSILARIGGEEFAVFMPDTEGIAMGAALSNAWVGPIAYDVAETGAQREVTLSLGAAHTQVGATLEDLMLHADMALYKAKTAGRARLFLWSPDHAPEDRKSA